MEVVAPKVQTNGTIRKNYREALQKLIDGMHADIEQVLLPTYKSETATLNDAAPPLAIILALTPIFKQWRKRFNDSSKPMATLLYEVSEQYYKARLTAFLKGESLLSPSLAIKISKDTRDIIADKRAIILENIRLIKSIPNEYEQRVQNAVFEGITRGLDDAFIADELRKIKGITDRRAKTIARDQSAKANTIIQHGKWEQLGNVDEAVWLHSSAGKVPRQSHVKANGSKYDIRKGKKIDGEFIFPGQLINCRCVGQPILNI